MLRLAGAELVQVPAAPYRNPNNFVRYSERLAARAGQDRAERRDLGQPVRQRRQPAGPCRDHRPGDLGADRRQGRRLRLRRRLGRHAGGRRRGAAAQGREDRPGRPDGRGALQLLHHRRAGHGGQLDRRGHRPGADHREPRRLHPRFRLSDSRRGGAAFRLRSAARGGAGAWAARPAINIAGAVRLARDLGPGHTIVTVLCDYGTRYQSKLFNPAFLREKGLPVPDWMKRGPASIPGVFEDA